MIYLDKPSFDFKQDRDDTLYFHYRHVDLTKHNVKYILTPCTGVDHVDFEYCKLHGIKVFYVDDKHWLYENIWATAEHTVFLMLLALKDNFDRTEYNHELRGKKIGIIGFGRIGQQVKNIVTAFGANILHCDKEMCISDVLENADIVTVHVPLNDETKGIIKRNELRKFLKRGGVFVNVSRPAIVEDEEGDYESVRTKDSIYKTYHVAGNTLESRLLTDKYVLRNFLAEIK